LPFIFCVAQSADVLPDELAPGVPKTEMMATWLKPLPEEKLNATPRGRVLDLKGARTVFELNAEWNKRFAARRAENAKPENDDRLRAKVRELIGARKLADLTAPTVQKVANGYIITPETGIQLPAKLEGDANSESFTIFLHGAGNQQSNLVFGALREYDLPMLRTLLGEQLTFHDAVNPDGTHAAMTPAVPRSSGKMGRHLRINDRVSEGNVDLIFIGDSITSGWESRGPKVWDKFYGKRNAANLGIGGDRTQHVIWRLNNGNVKGISPKAAVVMIGTNNSRDNTPEQIADGVTVIINQLRSKLPETKVLLLAIFPRGANDDERRRVNEKANAIFSKLADGDHIHYLDIGPKFMNDDGELTRGMMLDLLHLTEQGYTIWAESIESSLSKLLGE
jgi:lysophospholipase L1-like esterase